MEKQHIFESEHYRITGARIITGRPDEVLEDHSLIIRKGKVAAIIPKAEPSNTPFDETYHLPGYTVLPGLIDAHVHLAGCRTSPEEQELGGILEHPLARAMRSAANAQALLRCGFTSVRDISWNGLYLKRIIHEGSLPGPRIVACGPGLSRTGGHGDLFALPRDFVRENHFWACICDGPEDLRKSVRMILREGADQIKLWISGGDNYPTDRNRDTHYTLEEVRAAVEEAKMIRGTMVCAHCENTESIRFALLAGVDTIEHGEALDEETAEMMAEQGSILVPTLGLLLNWRTDFAFQENPATVKKRTHAFYQREMDQEEPDEEEERTEILQSFHLALKKKIPVALGSDTVYEPVTEYGRYGIRELITIAECGMTHLQALHAATAVASRALGLGDSIGTLEPGKIADFLVTEGNPDKDVRILENPDSIRWIVQSGRKTVEDGKVKL